IVLGPGCSASMRAALKELLPEVSGLRPPPVILFETDVVTDGDSDWKALTRDGTVRRVHSCERLLDQAAFFLHQSVDALPEGTRGVLEDLHRSDRVLPGKRVLIVDDDMRNIFALSSVLEEHDMAVVAADNGRDAIQILQSRRDIDIVLMDIMMPEMDGIDTM